MDEQATLLHNDEEGVNACITNLILSVSQRKPHAVAIRMGGEFTMTYGELMRQSEDLARILATRGAAHGSLVSILADRSPRMIVALLAILRTGAAYVPMDPGYPAARLQHMLAASGATLLVTESEVLRKSDLQIQTPVFHLDRWHPSGQPLSAVPELASAGPNDTAYVIFTSGSTGRPKGVAISHGAVANLCSSLKQRPGLSEHDTMLAITSISFDIAVAELFLPLTTGATIELASAEEAGDPLRLIARIRTSAITVLQATPVTWRMLINSGWQGSSHVTAWCGGEEMTPQLARDLLTRTRALWNMYGPTETTVWSSCARVHASMTFIPLGTPIARTTLHVLDEVRNEAAPGRSGELYIGGDGLAIGYWKDRAMTEASFPTVQLSGGPNVRLYKTGDRVQLHANGDLEFLGRVDRQIKLRGFRIEPGEVEHAARSCPGVRDAVVMRTEHQEYGEALTAYIVPSSVHNLERSELRRQLLHSLPHYMVPSIICVLDKLPVTPNGKVDRAALPAPQEGDRASRDAGTRPLPGTETRLESLWCNTLKLSYIGRNDNFFDLGGDSLLAAQLIARTSKTFGQRCGVASLLQFPTIASFARFLTEGNAPTYVALHTGRSHTNDGAIFWMDNPDRLQRLASLLLDYPFYSMLLPSSAIAAEAPHYRLEQLALRMVEQILICQRTGRYYIGGFCQNALLAYEVSQQLRARGHEVPLLIMIDPGSVSGSGRRRKFRELLLNRIEREWFHLRIMMREHPAMWLAYLQRRFESLRFEVEGRRWQRAALRGNLVTQAPELAQALFVSRLQYQPQPYDGRVLFVQPTIRPARQEREAFEGWRPLVENSEWRPIAGDHLSLFAAPGVHKLADTLQQALDPVPRSTMPEYRAPGLEALTASS